jgi:hypothetical protein
MKCSEKMRGKLSIKIEDGLTFSVKPFRKMKKSPLDVKGIDLYLSADEIVDIIRAIRER